MLSGLPDRPLYQYELDALAEGDAIHLAIPATSESIRDNEEGRQQIHDLLLFVREFVAAVAYDEEKSGWIVIAKEDSDEPYEQTFDAILEYRGYKIDREDALREVVKELYGLSDELFDVDVDALENDGRSDGRLQ
jgi:predicted transcriptional regulator